MATTSNAVFISYRRDTGAIPAAALFQGLSSSGVDAFYDVNSIRAGTFDTVILSQIELRPYFVLVLTPGSLERCTELGDWVRREIEHALTSDRVILPMYSERFSFSEYEQHLPPRMSSALLRFNAIPLPQEWTSSAVRNFRDEFLPALPLPALQLSTEALAGAEQILQEARQVPVITARALAAQRKFEEGQTLRIEENEAAAIAAYTMALDLIPDFADAFFGRGGCFYGSGEFEKAIYDFGEAIRYMPGMHEAWQARGCARYGLGDHHGAVSDFNEAIRLKPDYSRAFKNRAAAFEAMKDDVRARADLDESLRLEHNAEVFYRRAQLRLRSHDKAGAIHDLNRAIELDSSFQLAFLFRGALRKELGDEDGMIADYKRSQELDPDSPLQIISYGRLGPIQRLRRRFR